jgi:hypothetical protein
MRTKYEISWVALAAAFGLGLALLTKLKQHVDNPGQTPMDDDD